jgi:hypothetical protein
MPIRILPRPVDIECVMRMLDHGHAPALPGEQREQIFNQRGPLVRAGCESEDFQGNRAKMEMTSVITRNQKKRSSPMRIAIQVFAGLFAISLLGAAPALAHHGWSAYDSSKPVTLAGTITEVFYTYPHATVKLDVSGKTWLAVLAPPSRMSLRGISASDLKAGMAATVEGFPKRDDAGEMRAERITLGGKVYELR